MINFDTDKHYSKLKDGLNYYSSNVGEFKSVLIYFIAFSSVILIFCILSVLIISVLFHSENVDWYSIKILYFIAFIFIAFFCGASTYRYILNIVDNLFHDRALFLNSSDRKYRLIEAIKCLDKTTEFIDQNSVSLDRLDFKNKHQIEKSLNSYFENGYLTDILSSKYSNTITEIKNLLNSKDLYVEENDLQEILSINSNIPQNEVKESSNAKSLNNIDSFTPAPSFETEFYTESNVHSIFDAKELFTLINSSTERKDINNNKEIKPITSENYVEQYLRNVELGKLGEYFVMHFERNRLFSNGQRQFYKQVKHVSEDYGDKFGYDILSFTSEGREMYIEVKTTSAGFDTGFYLSNNEYQKLMNNSEYYIYRVFNFDREKLEGMIYKINKSTFDTYFINSPKQYKVSVK
jgi:Domain of unknown function (DUF3883)